MKAVPVSTEASSSDHRNSPASWSLEALPKTQVETSLDAIRDCQGRICDLLGAADVTRPEWGLPIEEIFDLEEVGRTCEQEERSNFFVASAP